MLRIGVVLVLLSSVFVYWLIDTFSSTLHIESPTVLVVNRGDHLGGIATRLKQLGQLPWSPRLVSLYGQLTAADRHIQVGEYELLPSMSVPELVMLLHSGDVIQRTITFPEGWTLAQWVSLLASNELLVDNSENTLLNVLQPISDWEGQLYPDTYAFTRGESAMAVLDRAKARMQTILEDVWQQRSEDTQVKTPYEALILASMIEKETGYGGDRGLISSVFNNRLQISMKLQSDPTVIYGLEGFDGDLKRRHLKIPHAYNTYVIDALPIAPICNPGTQSLLAALNPERSNYFYFVARGDGKSQFSETLQQHNSAVNRFQKAGRVENYRSVPEASGSERSSLENSTP